MGRHTNLIELDDVRLGALLTQELFRGLAVGAPGLAEDGWKSVSISSRASS